jgi:hypothetical protein
MSFIVVKYGKLDRVFNTNCQVCMLLDSINSLSASDIVKVLKKRHEEIAKEKKTNQQKKTVAEQKIKLCEEKLNSPNQAEPSEEKKKSEKKEGKKKEEKGKEAKKEEKPKEAKKEEKPKEAKKEEKPKEAKKEEKPKEAKKEEKAKEPKKEEKKEETKETGKKDSKKKEQDATKKKEEKKKLPKEDSEIVEVVLSDDELNDLSKTKQSCIDEITKLDSSEILLKATQEKIAALKESYAAPSYKEENIIDLQDEEEERKFLQTKKMDQAKVYLTEKATYTLVKIIKENDEDTAVKIEIDETLLNPIDADAKPDESTDPKKKQAQAKAKKM